jgi:hypothetical protein
VSVLPYAHSQLFKVNKCYGRVREIGVLVPRRQSTQNKIIRAGRATSHSPPTINRRNHTRPLHPKSTPAILLLPHCWGELTVLATQSQGDSTCACDCEARIVSLPLPAEKIISQSAQKHHDDCNSSAVISRSVPTRQVRFSPRPTRTPVYP